MNFHAAAAFNRVIDIEFIIETPVLGGFLQRLVYLNGFEHIK